MDSETSQDTSVLSSEITAPCARTENTSFASEVTVPPGNDGKTRRETSSWSGEQLASEDCLGPLRRDSQRKSQAMQSRASSSSSCLDAAEDLADSGMPQLLAMVQATCHSLADRLKAQTPGRSGEGRKGGAEEVPPPAAVIAAAKAARDLLSEVETAFLSGSGSTSPALGVGVGTPRAYNLTQWFNMGTPIGGPCDIYMGTPIDCGSAGASASAPTSSSPRRQRHSCPPPRCDDTASATASGAQRTASPAARGTPRNVLGDWLCELRRVDPWPLLRPPHVQAPQSPRPHAELAIAGYAVTPQGASTPRNVCVGGAVR